MVLAHGLSELRPWSVGGLLTVMVLSHGLTTVSPTARLSSSNALLASPWCADELAKCVRGMLKSKGLLAVCPWSGQERI